MTDYTKLTNFAEKDNLASGEEGKIVSGAEIDQEFVEIANAVRTKADLQSPALTGTPTAPTASTDTNTTQIATTAFVQQEINATLTAGTEGLDGNSFIVLYVYRRASSAPSTPTGGEFDFDTLILTAPSGWSRNVPSGTDPVYVSTATATTVGSTGVDDTLTWSTPVIAFQNGDDGTTEDTKFASGYLYYNTSSSSAPTAPVEDVDTTNFNFSTGTFDTIKAGWTHVFSVPNLAEGQQFWAVYYTVEEDVDGVQTITISNSAFRWLNFDGLITFTNIQTGIANNVTSIDGGKIATNTLNANAIETGTLTADKISSGNVDSGVAFQLGSDVDAIGGIDAGASFKSTSSSKAGMIAANTTAFPALVAGNVAGSLVFAGSFYNTTSSSFNTINTYADLASNSIAGNFQNQNSSTGIQLATPSYAYLTNGGASGTFTGAHDGLLPKTQTPVAGDIVVDVETFAKPNVFDTISKVTVSTTANQSGVVGVYAWDADGEHVPPALMSDDQQLDSQYASVYNTHKNIVMNGVGEGLVNVCGENGNIEIGDLIVSSNTEGKGMKQSDDIVRGCTVAKAREAVTFSSPDEVKQIACIYLCG